MPKLYSFAEQEEELMAAKIPTQAGEPIVYQDKDIIPLECCDCGLVHWIMVDINGKEVILRFFRDDYQTDKIRKKAKLIIYRKRSKSVPTTT